MKEWLEEVWERLKPITTTLVCITGVVLLFKIFMFIIAYDINPK